MYTPAIYDTNTFQKRAVSPTTSQSSSQIAEDVVATYLRQGSHDVSPVSRPLTAESLADLGRIGTMEARPWVFTTLSPPRTPPTTPEAYRTSVLDPNASPSAKVAAAHAKHSPSTRLKNAQEIASYVASHGYSIKDDDRIRVGAHLLTQLSAADNDQVQRDIVTNPDTRDAILAMAKQASTNETIIWVANAIGNLVKDPILAGPPKDHLESSLNSEFPAPRLGSPQEVELSDVEQQRITAGMEPMRDALLHLAHRSTNAHASLCIARAMHRVVVSNVLCGQRAFGTQRVRKALLYMSSRTQLPSETCRWLSKCISAITSRHIPNQLMFGGISQLRDVLLPFVLVASSTESAEAIAGVFEALLVPPGGCGAVGAGGDDKHTRRNGQRDRERLQPIVELFSIDDVRHALMILSGFRPSSTAIIISVANALHELCGWGVGADLLSHGDTMRTFIALMRQCGNPDAAEAILRAITRLAATSRSLTPAYCDPTFRDTIIHLGEVWCSSPEFPGALNAWCCAVNNLSNWDELAQMFAVTTMRQALIHVGKEIHTAELAHWWCAALVSISVRADNKKVFGSNSSRILLCQLGRRAAVTAEAVTWIGYAIYSLVMDSRCCRIFQHAQMRTAFVCMARYATSADAVTSLCNALAHITHLGNGVEDGLAGDSMDHDDGGPMDDYNDTMHQQRRSSSRQGSRQGGRRPDSRNGDPYGLEVEVDEHGHIDSVTLNEHIEAIFSTSDVRDSFVEMAPFTTTSDAATAWCCAITNLIHNEPSRFRFGSSTLRDAIHRVGRYVVSADAAGAWCQVVGQLCVSQENRPLFHTPALRHALYTIAIHCTTDTAATSFGFALATITVEHENKLFYGTTKGHDMLVKTAAFVESPEAARRWASAVRSLSVLDDNRVLFGTRQLRDAIVMVSYHCTRAEAVSEWCSAVKAICIKAESKRLYGETMGVRDALIRLAKHAWSPDAVRALCVAITTIAMDSDGRRVLMTCTPLANAVALLATHATSSLSLDAHATAVKLFQSSSPTTLAKQMMSKERRDGGERALSQSQDRSFTLPQELSGSRGHSLPQTQDRTQ